VRNVLIVIVIGVLTLQACRPSTQEVDVQNVSVRKLLLVDSCNIDSMAAVDVHLYKDYVLCVAPQSHFGSCPYALFRRESLEYVGMVGAFGHSSQEFMDVNPYYLGKTGDSSINWHTYKML
jgi:hypothetical protein